MIKKIVRIILSVLLILSLMGLVLVYSISKEVNEEAITDIINQVINSGADEENIDFGEAYDALIEDCEGQESIILGDGRGSLELSCFDLETVERDGFENYFKEEVSEEAQGGLKVNYNLINKWFWIFGVTSLILVLGIGFLVKTGSFTNLGIVGILAGAPFIVSGIAKKTMENVLKEKILEAGGRLDDLPGVVNLINRIADGMFINFLIVFGVGFLLLIIGFIIFIVQKKNESK